MSVSEVKDHRWRLAALVPAVAAMVVIIVLPATSASAQDQGSGPVDVLYAGSLVTLMDNSIGPAFTQATGFTMNGVAAGSTALAAEIQAGTQEADVFISAAPSPNTPLMTAAGGHWVSWYSTFATSPLVLGYNPDSSFARQLKIKPWYDVVTEPGFRLGRTDPATDPKGVLAVQALDQAARSQDDPALAAVGTASANVYPEQTMVGELQAGQLDAGFFYTVEASAAGIKTVPLKGIDLQGVYTITVVNRAPHPAAAEAFVSFLLGRKGRALLAKSGLVTVRPPELTGSKRAVPATLRSLVSSKS